MLPTHRQLQLAQGLRVQLVHQPDAQRAAALVQVTAGSHDEPAHWPGLAHLLEHLLFTGSERWSGAERLMPWIQANGGRVNATTQLRRSAYFFEADPALLAGGLARLKDMLIAPLLSSEAVSQEIAVIDAEYSLIKRHHPSRHEAALFTRIASPGAFHAFHIGSRAAFGDDTTALTQALRQFHQLNYHAGNMQLWLQGPQTLDELEALANAFADRLPGGQTTPEPPPPSFRQQTRIALQSAGPPAVWISSLLTEISQPERDSVTLVREFLQDEATGGVMAMMREQADAKEIDFQWLYLTGRTAWLAVKICAARADEAYMLYRHALLAIAQTSTAQRRHYLALAQQRFNALAPLEQLRERAFGFTPPHSADGLDELLQALLQAPLALLCSRSAASGRTVNTQGFQLRLAHWAPCSAMLPLKPLSFYPRNSTRLIACLPDVTVPLTQRRAGSEPAILLIRPEFFTRLSMQTVRIIENGLRPRLAELRHLGGEGSWLEIQGVWQLLLRLTDNSDGIVISILAQLEMLTRQDSAFPSGFSDKADDVAIRQLFHILPQSLNPPSCSLSWRAALYGGSPQLYQMAAHSLSQLTSVNDPAVKPAYQHDGKVVNIEHSGPDNALLVFIPRPGNVSLAALRALAMLLQPQFFQQLRVEQQIGYVADCRYLRSADYDGLVLALQSPMRPVSTLLYHCKKFLLKQRTQVSCAAITLIKKRLLALATENADAATVLSGALRRENGLEELSECSIDELQADDPYRALCSLIRHQRSWTVLSSSGKSDT